MIIMLKKESKKINANLTFTGCGVCGKSDSCIIRNYWDSFRFVKHEANYRGNVVTLVLVLSCQGKQTL